MVIHNKNKFKIHSPPGVEYLTKSLHRVIEALDEEELRDILIVVAMMDREKKTREDRAKILYRKFRTHVDGGLVSIVAPTSTIYPVTNFYGLRRRPFNNSVERMEWQAKLSLDFAFLFSFCSILVRHNTSCRLLTMTMIFQGDFFMNLEDDIVPVNHFVREALAYVRQREEAKEDWSSLQFSNYLSIGRLYRSTDLGRLVDLILISYTRMPVDFISRKFDLLLVGIFENSVCKKIKFRG